MGDPCPAPAATPLRAVVRAADVHDRDGARMLADRAVPNVLPSLPLVWADQGCTGALADRLRETRGWRLDVVRHRERHRRRYGPEPKAKGVFRVLPRRRAVERTFAWPGRGRRLSKDCERLPATTAAMISGATGRLMLRRLARPSV